MRKGRDFWDHVEKTDTCWWWTGSPNKAGYGQFTLNGERRSAHRASYDLNVGPIPNGLYVCHHCDHKLCVRPDHLFLGTLQDNVADAVAKGLMARGERNGLTKLTEADVLFIRSDSGLSQNALARRFGITQPSVSKIRSRVSWGHVPEAERVTA